MMGRQESVLESSLVQGRAFSCRFRNMTPPRAGTSTSFPAIYFDTRPYGYAQASVSVAMTLTEGGMPAAALSAAVTSASANAESSTSASCTNWSYA